jgi:hypothetical protein
MLANFPLFLISFAIYNMIVFLTPGVGWTDLLFTVPLQSGARWTVTLGDALIGLSLVFLFAEVVKATRDSGHPVFDQLLSTVVLIAAFVEFLFVPQAANSVFAILLLIALIDVLAGWTASLRGGKRDLTVEAMPDSTPTP